MRWTRAVTQGYRSPLSRIVVRWPTNRFDPSWIVAGLAVMAFAWFARDLVVPIAAAALLYYTFAPAKRWLCRRGFPPILVSLAFVSVVLVVLVGGVMLLAQPMARWVDEAPAAISKLQRELGEVRGPVDKVKDATAKVEDMTKADTAPGTMEVVVRDRNLVQRIFGGFSDFATTLGATLILLFYLLVRPAPPERAFVGCLRTLGTRRSAMRAIRKAEHDLALYLGTVAVINFVLGAIGAVVFWAIGLPNPIVLGAAMMILNFVPFLGAIAAIVLTFLVGLGTFDTVTQAMIAPLVVATLHLIEANFITPTVLGNRLTLDPFLVFVSLLAGAWIWGVAGALMAVPMLLFFAAARAAYLEYRAVHPAPPPAAAGEEVAITVDPQAAQTGGKSAPAEAPSSDPPLAPSPVPAGGD